MLWCFLVGRYPWQAHERLAAKAILETMGVVTASIGNTSGQ